MKFQQFCTLCQPQPLTAHMIGALTEKYSTSIHFHHLQQLQTLIQDIPQSLNIAYRQSIIQSDDSQYLKRVYHLQQFPNKIKQLGQYYKFSRDLPKCIDKKFISTIQKYQDKLRQLDFQKVKAAVKKQQGISLSSYRQDSSFPNSQCQIKSNYSSVLHCLNDTQNQSNILNNICQQIEEALPDSHHSSAFKGYFPEGTKKFQNFLEKEEKKIHCFNKKKREKLIKNDNKQNTMKNGLNLIRNRSKKIINKNYNQKTRANDTISRQQKFKKNDKQVFRTLDHDLALRSLINPMFKKNHQKNIQQMYKGCITNHQVKYHSNKEKISEKVKKGIYGHSAKNSTLTRNNSKHQYIPQTDRQTKQTSKTKILRSSVQKSIEKNKRQSSLQSYKVLPLMKTQKQNRQKTLSRSKSKSRLSKQSSRESIKLRPQSIHQISKMSDNHNHVKKYSNAKTMQEKSNIDKIIYKKLALFMH